MNVLITCEIDKTKRVVPFVAYSGNIWMYHDYIDADDEADAFWVDGFGGNLDDTSNTRITISSFVVGSTIYARMISIDDLYTIKQNAFYWDQDEQKLYVKFYDQQPWYIQESVRAGQTYQYSSRAQNDSNGRPTDSYIDDLYLEPRVILSSINSSRKEDAIEDNKMVFSSFSFDILNTDGELDSVRSEVINLGGRIKLAEVEDGEAITVDDLRVVRNGFIENVSFPDDDSASFTCADPRDVLKNKIGVNVFNTTDYTDLSDDLVDTRKPIALGNLRRIPCIRVQSTNLDPPTPPWTTDNTIDFLISDPDIGGIVSVSNVYLDGTLYERDVTSGRWERMQYYPDEPIDSSLWSVNTTTNILTVEQFSGGKVYVDCVGYQPDGTSKMTSLALYCLEEFAGINYLESFFFKDETDSIIEAKSGMTGGYYIDKNGVELKKVIDALLGSINVILVEKEDRYTMRDLTVPDVTADIRNIDQGELVSTPVREYDTDKYMSSIRVSFNKRWDNNEFEDSLDDSLEATAIDENSLQYTYEFETYLDTKADAEDIRDERYTIVPPLYLKCEFNTTLGFEQYEYVIHELKRRNGNVIESYAMYRVVDIDEVRRTATLKYIKAITYSGDTPTEVDVIPVYQQGWIYEDRLYEHRLFSVTQGA